MTTKERLLAAIEQTPEPLLEELLDFLLFARNRRYPELDTDSEDLDLQLDKPLWQFAEDLMKDAPIKALEQLPADAARNHDYYLYGTLEQ